MLWRWFGCWLLRLGDSWRWRFRFGWLRWWCRWWVRLLRLAPRLHRVLVHHLDIVGCLLHITIHHLQILHRVGDVPTVAIQTRLACLFVLDVVHVRSASFLALWRYFDPDDFVQLLAPILFEPFGHTALHLADVFQPYRCTDFQWRLFTQLVALGQPCLLLVFQLLQCGVALLPQLVWCIHLVLPVWIARVFSPQHSVRLVVVEPSVLLNQVIPLGIGCCGLLLHTYLQGTIEPLHQRLRCTAIGHAVYLLDVL